MVVRRTVGEGPLLVEDSSFPILMLVRQSLLVVLLGPPLKENLVGSCSAMVTNWRRR